MSVHWIPSHMGIPGNEMVDQQAKTSFTLFKDSIFKSSINKYNFDEGQTSWNNSIRNTLLEIKPIIGEYQSVVRNIRKLKRNFGSTSFTSYKSYNFILILGGEQSQCVGSDAPFTVRHFL